MSDIDRKRVEAVRNLESRGWNWEDGKWVAPPMAKTWHEFVAASDLPSLRDFTPGTGWNGSQIVRTGGSEEDDVLVMTPYVITANITVRGDDQ